MTKLKTVITILLLTALTGFVGWRVWQAYEKKEAAEKSGPRKGGQAAGRVISVTVAQARKGAVRHEIEITGSLKPKEQVDVTSKVTGRVEKINVQVGDFVKRGQILAELEDDEIALQHALALIANSDMHLGNAAMQLQDTRPLPLAPVYDMLPMTFRPASNGEIVERRYPIALPAPEHVSDWLDVAPAAQAFWQRVAVDERISPAFRAIAADADASVARAFAHLAG